MRRKIDGYVLDTKTADLVVHVPAVKLSWKCYVEVEKTYYLTKRDKILFEVVKHNGVFVIVPSKWVLENDLVEHDWDLDKRREVLAKYDKLYNS